MYEKGSTSASRKSRAHSASDLNAHLPRPSPNFMSQLDGNSNLPPPSSFFSEPVSPGSFWLASSFSLLKEILSMNHKSIEFGYGGQYGTDTGWRLSECLLRNVSIYQFSNLKHSKALWMGWSRVSLQDQRVFTIRLTTTLTNGFSDALTLSNWQSHYHRT